MNRATFGSGSAVSCSRYFSDEVGPSASAYRRPQVEHTVSLFGGNNIPNIGTGSLQAYIQAELLAVARPGPIFPSTNATESLAGFASLKASSSPSAFGTSPTSFRVEQLRSILRAQRAPTLTFGVITTMSKSLGGSSTHSGLVEPGDSAVCLELPTEQVRPLNRALSPPSSAARRSACCW